MPSIVEVAEEMEIGIHIKNGEERSVIGECY
jgi:hypothetical protein